MLLFMIYDTYILDSVQKLFKIITTTMNPCYSYLLCKWDETQTWVSDLVKKALLPPWWKQNTSDVSKVL